MTDALFALRPVLLALTARRRVRGAAARAGPRPRPAHRRLHRRRRQPGAGHRRPSCSRASRRVREDAARSAPRLPPDDRAAPRGARRADRRARAAHQRARQRPARRRRRARPRGGQRGGAEPDDAWRSCASGCARDGIDYARFRTNLRDQMLIERMREREVQARIRISDAEIDACLDKRRAAAGAATEYNIAQILVTVPEGAERGRRGRAPRARRGGAGARRRPARPSRRWRARSPKTATAPRAARSACARPTACPTCSSRRCARSRPARWRRTLLRTGAGFHVLKLVDKREAGAFAHAADARAPHPAAPVAAADRRTPRARAWPSSSARSRAGTRELRGARARELRGRQRRAGRRPRLGRRRASSCPSSRRR